ncbi:hypothetical protein SeLEV6574_g02211 [Synchytrium endobioticum]|uniref:peptidylprolyl isomerase n=1 Tax=Synchytrium endobioticum TaxID=286115 RepID=A0A507D948_9FUNG|nr:hypothetical protein SeLEV6574_g02211 [Synchytrium endobioticum]
MHRRLLLGIDVSTTSSSDANASVIDSPADAPSPDLGSPMADDAMEKPGVQQVQPPAFTILPTTAITTEDCMDTTGEPPHPICPAGNSAPHIVKPRTSVLSDRLTKASSYMPTTTQHKVGTIVKVTPDGAVTKVILKVGSVSEKPSNNDEIYVTYVGRLAGSAEVFDFVDNVDTPFTFRLGLGKVIRGWDEGVKTMTKGEQARFTIAPEYGYGAHGAGPKVPPNSTLEFDVTLLGWKSVTSLTDDGKVTMTMIKTDASAWQTPKDGWEVRINYTGRVKGLHAHFEKAENAIFEIGADASTMPPFLSSAIKTFKRGEIGRITIHPGHAFGPSGDASRDIPPHAVIEYTYELLDWHEVEKLDGDKITKTTIKHGVGLQRPKHRCAVRVNIRGTAVPSQSCVTSIVDSWYVLGSGGLPEAVELALEKMKKGESATIKAPGDYGYGNTKTKELGIAPGERLEFEATLHEWNEKKKSEDMSQTEKFEAAEDCRVSGNELFRDGKWRSAARQYDQIVNYFQNDTDATAEEKTRADALLLSAYLNLIACHLKLKHPQPFKLLEIANQAIAIKPASAKALYRRAQVHCTAQEFEKALHDIRAALKLEPKDPALRAEYIKITERLKAYRKGQKQLFQKMFGVVKIGGA